MNSISEAKSKIQSLKGQKVFLTINKGRNKIVKLHAIIEQVYPSMFVINPQEIVDLDRKSFSYNDMLCGDISIK